jgi:hypothetical protein
MARPHWHPAPFRETNERSRDSEGPPCRSMPASIT